MFVELMMKSGTSNILNICQQVGHIAKDLLELSFVTLWPAPR